MIRWKLISVWVLLAVIALFRNSEERGVIAALLIIALVISETGRR